MTPVPIRNVCLNGNEKFVDKTGKASIDNVHVVLPVRIDGQQRSRAIASTAAYGAVSNSQYLITLTLLMRYLL